LEDVSWGLGRGDDDGLNNDKEPSNEEILRKDKEQGQDDLAKNSLTWLSFSLY
jgi:hypothetical protein